MTEVAIEPSPDYLSTVPKETPFGFEFADEGLINPTQADKFDEVQTGRDLDGLLALGYLTDRFTLYGHTFDIRTLRRGEKLAVAELVQRYADSFGVGDAISAVTVAACIVLVDGRALTTPLGPGEDVDPVTWLRRAFEIVAKWYDPVIEQVYQKYLVLLQRQAQAFLEFQGKA